MNQPKDAATTTTTNAATLYVAFELSLSIWKLGFADAQGRRRSKGIAARDHGALLEQLKAAKAKFGLPEDARVVSCYEAGREGFSLHRFLKSAGIESLVVDAASIEVDRRSRRAKTDRLDLATLLDRLMRFDRGETGVWSVVRAPSFEEEDERRLHRELERLTRERIQHRNRIRSLLFAQGVAPDRLDAFLETLDESVPTLWDGRPLPRRLKAEIDRERERLEVVSRQIRALEKEHAEAIKKGETSATRKIQTLILLRSLGPKSAWILVMEFFGWRSFRNRRELGAAAGLTGTPYSSGKSNHEQGISKAGSRRIRNLMIELAWLWLRLQPDSKLSLWFQARFAKGGRRMRRVGIVAVARRLLIDLWHFVEHGTVPVGAKLKRAA